MVSTAEKIQCFETILRKLHNLVINQCKLKMDMIILRIVTYKEARARVKNAQFFNGVQKKAKF